MTDEEGPAPIPLSALQHWAYCPRQCALIHIEQAFDENLHTLRGNALHARVDQPGLLSERGLRVERALPLWHDGLGLIGKADVVEFQPDGTPYPVEYKQGSRHKSAAIAACDERALVQVSRTHSLTQTHALFLEWLSLDTARRVGRYDDANGNAGSRPHTPAPLEADCREVFETGQILLATLGHPLFTALPQAEQRTRAPELFFCRSGGAEGRGLYTTEGFVVLAGSVGRLAHVPSIQGTSDANFRDKLLRDGVMVAEGGAVHFTRDHLFRSPSMAAVALLGRTANGWLEWKTDDGQTLDAVKRQAIERESPKAP